jgi:hypothetical protein
MLEKRSYPGLSSAPIDTLNDTIYTTSDNLRGHPALKDFKKLIRYVGFGVFIIGGICMLMTIAQTVSYLGSLNLFNDENAISSIINLITISIFCFVLGWVFVDFFQ